MLCKSLAVIPKQRRHSLASFLVQGRCPRARSSQEKSWRHGGLGPSRSEGAEGEEEKGEGSSHVNTVKSKSLCSHAVKATDLGLGGDDNDSRDRSRPDPDN